MITISVSNKRSSADKWAETSHGWSLKEDYINVVNDKFLHRRMIALKDETLFVVAERNISLPQSNLSNVSKYIVEFASLLEGDGVLIHLENHGRLTIFMTSHSTVTNDVSGENYRFTAGWDFNALIGRRQSLTFSRTQLRRFIQFGPELSQETIALNVAQLMPGQKAEWTLGSDQIEFTTCTPVNFYEESPLAVGATLTSTFLDLIKASSVELLKHASVPTVELSGGMDSSCVAIALRYTHGSWHSYGLIHRGNAGDQQLARRRELIDQLKTADTRVHSTVCKPFTRLENPPLAGDFVISPYDELYWDGIVEAFYSMPNGKPDVVFTGIGGDELTITTLFDDETAPQKCCPNALQSLFFQNTPPVAVAPQTFVSQSALASAFVRARIFLTHDIWPKNPLIDPAVVRFCQIVPPEHKRHRLLNRLTIAKAGLSDYFVNPRFKENFSRVFMDDFLDFRSDIFFCESLLHAEMIANSALLMNAIRDIQNGSEAKISLYVIINAVRLEYILRYYSDRFSIKFVD
jgi:hypothetical protein